MRKEIIYPFPIPEEIILKKNVLVSMRDGIQLSVDIYFSENRKSPCPAILAYSPFQKERSFESPKPQYYCSKGFVCIQASERGSGFNQGRFEMHGKKAAEDGYDLVEWIAEQFWCTGSVAMMGASGYAVMSWLTAIEQPPHLKTLVVLGTTDNYRGLCYPGGVLRKSFVLNLIFGFTQAAIWPGPIAGKEPPINIAGEILTRYEDGPFWWEHGGSWNRIDQVTCPVLNLMNTPNRLHAIYHLRSYPEIIGPKKLVITPWTNENYQPWIFETTAMNDYILRWLDHWMKEEDTGIMDEPEVAIYDNGTGIWRYENEYPIKRTVWQPFYLRKQNNQSKASSSISVKSPPEGEEPDIFFNVNLNFGMMASYGITASASNNNHYLSYLSDPLEEDMTINGPVSCTLYISTTEKISSDLSFFIKMGEMVPEGVPLNPITGKPELPPEVKDAWTPDNVQIWSYGSLKAKFREIDKEKSRPGLPWHSYQNPQKIEPDHIYEYQIEMQPVFKTFKKGSRIWMKIACDDPTHSTLDCDSQYVETPLDHSNREIRIYHELDYPSHILLPIIPGKPDTPPVSEPLSLAVPGAPRFI